MPDVLKLCSVCKQNKPISEFGPEIRRPSKLKYLCRSCDVERHRVRYFNPPDPEKHRQLAERNSVRSKARFADKKQRGECLFCANPAKPGSTQCDAHLLAARQRAKGRRTLLAITGICTRCGKAPQAPSMLLCQSCLDSNSANMRTRRWKVAPKPRKEYNRERYQTVKDECYAAYGGYKCKCCSETEPCFLTIDHVNDDGAAHRQGLYGKNWFGVIYRWLRRNGYPEGFRVLCHNCNSGRHRNGGICPHEEKRLAAVAQ